MDKNKQSLFHGVEKDMPPVCRRHFMVLRQQDGLYVSREAKTFFPLRGLLKARLQKSGLKRKAGCLRRGGPGEPNRTKLQRQKVWRSAQCGIVHENESSALLGSNRDCPSLESLAACRC